MRDALSVIGYRKGHVSIWMPSNGSPVNARRDEIDALIEQGYLEWVVPPLMVHRLDVTLAGRRYVEALGAGSVVHRPSISPTAA